MMILLVKIECKSAPLKKYPYSSTLMLKMTAAIKWENNRLAEEIIQLTTTLGYV
jgi:hypothetical protein